jgi:hypothetical protein
LVDQLDPRTNEWWKRVEELVLALGTCCSSRTEVLTRHLRLRGRAPSRALPSSDAPNQHSTLLHRIAHAASPFVPQLRWSYVISLHPVKKYHHHAHFGCSIESENHFTVIGVPPQGKRTPRIMSTTPSDTEPKAQESVPATSAAQQSDNIAHALAGAGGGLLAMTLT